MGTAGGVAAKGRHRVHLNLPDSLYRQLSDETQRRGMTLEQLLHQAIEQYMETEETAFDMTRTRTWELCGSLTVAEPEPEYVVGRDADEKLVTNYAEHVDETLYRSA